VTFAVAWCCGAVVGLLPACGAAVVAAEPDSVVGALAFVAVWEVALWRIVGVGLYVGDRGVKVRSVWRTRVLPWRRIDRAWAGPATGYEAWAIWISATEPRVVVETPIWRKGTRVRHRNRHKVDSVMFARLLGELNAEAAERTGPPRSRGGPG